MSAGPRERHHPLPADARARHDRLPEEIDARDRDDDAPDGETPAILPPDGAYREPDGRPYPGSSSTSR